jgi:hypothetical protein
MPFRYIDRLSVLRCAEEPDALFVFGDNLQRWGKAGQAVIRDCPNAVGIPTKKKPAMDPGAFFTSEDFCQFHIHADPAIKRLTAHLHDGGTVYWPKDNIGTGLARLPEKAPNIFGWIEMHRQQFEKLYPEENPRLSDRKNRIESLLSVIAGEAQLDLTNAEVTLKFPSPALAEDFVAALASLNSLEAAADQEFELVIIGRKILLKRDGIAVEGPWDLPKAVLDAIDDRMDATPSMRP